MDAFLTGPVLLQGGAWLVLLVVVVMVLRGQLVPRSTMTDVRTDRDARLAEKQTEVDTVWEAHRTLQRSQQDQAAQLSALMEAAKTQEQLLRALPSPQPVREGGPS